MGGGTDRGGDGQVRDLTYDENNNQQPTTNNQLPTTDDS
jgi:hypothetical protein